MMVPQTMQRKRWNQKWPMRSALRLPKKWTRSSMISSIRWKNVATPRDGRKIDGKRYFQIYFPCASCPNSCNFAFFFLLWFKEMSKHPFFMKEPPKPGDELHPMLEGLQQLKYDPLENTLEDLASTYKDDGNFDMKNKKYRMAIYSYTEGLNQKCENNELNATLYNNRSAAHFFLKNYR